MPYSINLLEGFGGGGEGGLNNKIKCLLQCHYYAVSGGIVYINSIFSSKFFSELFSVQLEFFICFLKVTSVYTQLSFFCITQTKWEKKSKCLFSQLFACQFKSISLH